MEFNYNAKDFISSLEKTEKEIIGQLYKNVEKACIYTKTEAQKNITAMGCVDEGLLRASMDYKVNVNTKNIEGTIFNNNEYAPFVHQGTGIYASDSNGRKTPWIWHGDSAKWSGWHITQGQKPKPFLENAVEDNIAKIENILKEGL